jgi:hypothetical protein
MNISVAVNYDYDADGDEDLFVGSRSVPYAYGEIPTSYIFQNNGQGQFKDVTPGQIANLGMVTDAVWVDVTGDSKSELVVTGQWMTTKIFSYSKNGFQELHNTGLENKFGWWQTIAAADVNGDGKQDLIVGNIGQNFYLRPDEAKPVKLWFGDFDGSGTNEHFLTRTVSKKDVPVFLKREITDQFPGLKKDNLRHSDFATKSIQNLFKKEVLSKTVQLQFNYCPSIVAINNGKAGFTIHPLPLMVQLSSVNSIYAGDLNSDGKKDLLLGGNMFGFPPQFGRLDASYGHVLMNDGNGGFRWIENKTSGINVKGEIKDIQEIKLKSGKAVLLTQNNEFPMLFKVNN